MISRTRADAIGNGIFLIALGFLYYYKWWWPGILLAVWASFSTRQILTYRMQDFLLTSVLLLSLFVIAYFELSWDLLMPLLFVLGGGYLIFKEFFYVSKEENSLELPRKTSFNDPPNGE